MKKDKDWLKEEASKHVEIELSHEFGLKSGKYISLYTLEKLIDQLDEPELLSSEWIKDHSDWAKMCHTGEKQKVVKVDKLESLFLDESQVVPSKMETTTPKQDDAIWFEEMANKLGVTIIEKVVVPRFVADFIKEIKERNSAMPLILYGAYLEAKKIPDVFDWVWKNSENHNSFAIAFITGKFIINPNSYWIVKLDRGRYVDNFVKYAMGVEIDIAGRLDCTAPIRFKEKAEAEAVALLVNGTIEEVDKMMEGMTND